MRRRWLGCALTDNGEEFADEDGIGRIQGEKEGQGELKARLFYCDPGQSQQKGSCEKNHTEIRQIPEKGMLAFDDLAKADMAALMSHANSNPRASLGGGSPIAMLRLACGGEDARTLMDALGIREMPSDELMPEPEILDIERAKRGESPVKRAK